MMLGINRKTTLWFRRGWPWEGCRSVGGDGASFVFSELKGSEDMAQGSS